MSTPAPRKPAERLAREERVEKILLAARDVFCEKGYENTVVAEIARSMGVVEGTIYKYFPTKRELLLKVLENWYDEMFGDYARDLAGVRGARARLRLLVWRHLRTVREHGALCRLMFREVRSGSDYRDTPVHALNRRYTQLLMKAIEEGVASGEFRHDVPLSLLRDMIYGGIEHHAWNYLTGRGSIDIDRIADEITAVLCDGIAPQRSATDLRRQAKQLAEIADRMERKPENKKRSRK